MDGREMDLLDRAYQRRSELMKLDGVRWVRMHIAPRGVVLTIGEDGGEKRTEWVPREPGEG
jgi:hypothetical protein